MSIFIIELASNVSERMEQRVVVKRRATSGREFSQDGVIYSLRSWGGSTSAPPASSYDSLCHETLQLFPLSQSLFNHTSGWACLHDLFVQWDNQQYDTNKGLKITCLSGLSACCSWESCSHHHVNKSGRGCGIMRDMWPVTPLTLNQQPDLWVMPSWPPSPSRAKWAWTGTAQPTHRTVRNNTFCCVSQNVLGVIVTNQGLTDTIPTSGLHVTYSLGMRH